MPRRWVYLKLGLPDAYEKSAVTTKVWNLMYALGNTDRIVGDSENPQSRKSALEGAAVIEKNGWRVWVEHQSTGKRILESAREIEHRRVCTSSQWGMTGNERTSTIVGSHRLRGEVARR